MKKCPNCGSDMDDVQKTCIMCGYTQKTKKSKLCPVCEEILIKGRCYRCGYKKRKRGPGLCPYCGERLIAGGCERCNYKTDKSLFMLSLKVCAIIGAVIILFRTLFL